MDHEMTGAAPTRKCGCAMQGLPVMVAMGIGLEEPGMDAGSS